MVLLKELPKEVKDSVTAYIGCLAGAITKKEYLEGLQSAGFRETKVIDEATFPPELLANDPTAREIMKHLNLSPEKAKELARSVVSMKVTAIKPAVY
jgi:arsenite methyltransferase